jgi:AcrR family transcriptional regulator
MQRKGARAAGGGRRPLLTLDEILDEAIRLGLTGVSMLRLAASLGTATSTLYNYVENREDLVRRAALRQARRAAGRNAVARQAGQDWRAFARAHARQSFDLWSSEPQLLEQYIIGSIGPEDLIEYMEEFLAAMIQRGFAPGQAYRILRAIDSVVHGAVIRSFALAALQRRGATFSSRIACVLHERRADELPNLRACAFDPETEMALSFGEPIERILDSFAAQLEGASSARSGADRRTGA